MNRSQADIRSKIPFLTAIVMVASFCATVIAERQFKIVSVKPTAFFIRKDNALSQLAEATVSNASQEQAQIALQVQIPGQSGSEIAATIPKGTTTVKFLVPDVGKATPATVVLTIGGKEEDRHSTTWQPQKKWHIFFIPITHHDLGYTDTIENVINRYAGFYNDILRFCRQTDDWPDEAKYHYTAEGAWAVQHFLPTADKKTLEELSKYVQQGRIELGALMGNEISTLCSHEELVRLMYPSFRGPNKKTRNVLYKH